MNNKLLDYRETVYKAELIITNEGNGKYSVIKSRYESTNSSDIDTLDLIILLEKYLKEYKIRVAEEALSQRRKENEQV